MALPYPAIKPHGLMFHRFHLSDDLSAGQGSVSGSDFARIIELVTIDRILAPEAWLAKTRAGTLEPQDLCITFDDGLASQYEVALPILEHYGLKAFWFVFSSVFNGGLDKNEVYNRFATGYFPSFDAFAEDYLSFAGIAEDAFDTDEYRGYHAMMAAKAPFFSTGDFTFRYARNFLMTRDRYEKTMDAFIQSKGLNTGRLAEGVWMRDQDLRRLKQAGHCIGLHSYDHPSVLKDLSPDAQKAQYEANMAHIRDVTGEPVECVAHPLNSYSADTLRILAGLGIYCGFRSDMLTPQDGAGPATDMLEIPREDSTHLLNAL